jgi:hypothetical protein
VFLSTGHRRLSGQAFWVQAGDSLADRNRSLPAQLVSDIAGRRPARSISPGIAGPRSALGLFGLFGRSSDLRQLDAALRAVDVHPRLVPEAVKLTIVSLLKEEASDREPDAPAYRAAAALVGTCTIGADAFAGANGDGVLSEVEERIEAALQAGDSLDARLLMLMLHAGAMQPSVRDRYRLEIATE